MKTGCIKIRAKQHTRVTPISPEDHLRNKVRKGNKQKADNKLNELTDRYAKIHNDQQLNKMEMERKMTEPKVIQPTENMDTECHERPTQSTANKA